MPDIGKLILASASPRRRDMLRHLGIEPTVVTSQATEDIDAATPEEAVKALAQRKAEAVKTALSRPSKSGKVYLDERDVIIAADTIVVSPDGELMGKPESREDAARMLYALQDREHRVISGVCVIRGERVVTDCEVTYVTFAHMGDDVIRAYVDSGEGDDKAGSYGVQDTASLWISGLRGDYFNVVGLPLHRLEALLNEHFALSLLNFRG